MQRNRTTRLHVEPLEDRTLLSTCHVTRLSDSGVGKGFRGDLRYCINKVNAEPGPDAIDFTVTGTINLTGALPDLASDIDIQGPGANLLGVRRDTAVPFRIFTVGTGTVSLKGLALSNGWETVGGGIYNQGELLLDDVAVSFNFAKEQGGGIYNAGHLEIYNSRVDINRVELSFASSTHDFGGGGIYNVGDLRVELSQITANFAFTKGRLAGGGLHNAMGGTATIYFSTISDNDVVTESGMFIDSYPHGGGIYTAGTFTLHSSAVIRNSVTDQPGGNGSVLAAGGGIYSTCTAAATLVLNSTITENDATSIEIFDQSVGGGISACPNTTIRNSSITKNLARASEIARGGGVRGDVYMYNSIVANNAVTDSNGPDYSGTLKGSGHNIFGNSGGVSGYADSDLLDVDPLLGPLADNGGPTLTHALLPGSPAIDAGDNTDAPEWDQRGPGFPRIVNGTIDIGAFEVQSTGAPSLPDYLAVLITGDFEKDDGSGG